jgi:NitT/TauT family transport system permease protein
MRILNRQPHPAASLLLPVLPFVLLIAAYLVASSARLAVNPDDKLLPSVASFLDAIHRFAFAPDQRTGTYLMLGDTIASLERLLSGLAIATAIAGVFGIAIGMIPYLRSLLASILAAVSLIPPLAILPIIFIVAGLGEASKITLIVIGTAPFLLRDLAMRVQELPSEEIIKAQTLGGSTWQIALRVVVPQMLPRLLDSVRLSLGSAWLFLISAEAIASESGLGYRIFLVRRYFAMDVILPYVAWITFLAFTLDYLLRLLQRAAFPWFMLGRGR